MQMLIGESDVQPITSHSSCFGKTMIVYPIVRIRFDPKPKWFKQWPNEP